MDDIQIVTPETIFPPRKRAFKPKTSTGCKTCRIRRIKCDEVRPACTQCTRGRRQCDGYDLSGQMKTFKSGGGSTPKQCKVVSRTRVAPAIAPKLFGSDTELRYFDFFVHQTIPGLAGPFKSEFWDQSVLQATRHESAIRHAIIAIAALHEGFVRYQQGQGSQSWQDDPYAVRHYVRAIQHLTTPVENDRESQLTDVALMTCVLFVCFEVLRGFHGAALAHIDGGIKLLTQMQTSSEGPSTRHYASVPIFTQVLSRLDKQASSITNHRPRNLLSTPISPCEKKVPEPKVVCFLANPFVSVEEARSALDKIQNAALRATAAFIDPTLLFDYASCDYIQGRITQGRGYSELRMKQWTARFNEYINAYKETLTLNDLKAIEVLRIVYVIMSINFRIDFAAVSKDEMLWDVYLPEFVSIVEHAQRFMDLENQEGKELPIFTLDMEIILPLYFVSAKCRDGTVRRQAIALLRSRDRQEGIWNANLTSRLAARLMIMEEEGLPKGYIVKVGDVKLERRVQGVDVRWSLEKRRVKLVYKCMDVTKGEKGVIEVSSDVPTG